MLKFPLHYYDEAGRLKPPVFFYLLMLFTCRAVLVLIVSVSMRDNAEQMMRLFYPQPYQFYLALLPIVPALTCLIIISRRQSLYASDTTFPFRVLIGLAATALFIDLAVQIYILNAMNFAFSYTYSVSLVLVIIGFWYLLRSKYLHGFVQDCLRNTP